MSDFFEHLGEFVREESDLPENIPDAIDQCLDPVESQAVRPSDSADSEAGTAEITNPPFFHKVYFKRPDSGKKWEVVTVESRQALLLAVHVLKLASHAVPLSPEQAEAPVRFPHIWTIPALLMSKKLRDEVFVPAYEEVKEDFLHHALEDLGPLERRTVWFIFSFRVIRIYWQSLQACFGEKVGRFLRWVGILTIVQYFFRLF